MTDIILYDYWRSSASYRVRIALNLKKLPYRIVPVDLVKAEHKSPAHLARQPQGLVPALDIDGVMLSQSLAIIEYLEQTRPNPALLPKTAVDLAKMRALCHIIAMEIHPVCNLYVANHVVNLTGGGNDARVDWMKHFIRPGLEAFEKSLTNAAKFCVGDAPSMADCCLMAQLYNATRWGIDYSDLATINRIETHCAETPEIAAAHPDRVRPDPVG